VGSVLSAVCAVAAMLGGWWLLIRRNASLTKTVMAAFFLFGLLSTVLMLPGSIPDEAAHIQTAYRYSNVLLFKPYATESGAIPVRSGDVSLGRFARYTTPRLSAYQEVADEWKWFASPEDAVMTEEAGRDVECGLMGYLPAAIGMAAARLLHLGTWPMIYLGRLCNLLFFGLLLYWAVRITPYKKKLFLMMGLVPASIQAAGSYSYDAPVIGLVLLALAWMLRLIFVSPRISWKEWLLCCMAAFVIFPCKAIYSTIFLMLVFIPAKKLSGTVRKLVFLSCVFICGCIGLVSANSAQFASYAGSMNADVLVHETFDRTVYSAGWVAAHPLEALAMIIRAIRDNFAFYLEGMFVSRLTRFDLRLDWTLVLLVVYALAGLSRSDETCAFSPRHKAVCVLIFAITAFGAFLSMLLNYTPFGSESVMGVQGRYFVPVLPVLLLAMNTSHIRTDDHADRWLAAIAIGCNAGVLCDLFYWIVVNQINLPVL